MAMALSYGTTDYIEGGVITAVIVRIVPCIDFSDLCSQYHHRLSARIQGGKDNGLTPTIIFSHRRSSSQL